MCASNCNIMHHATFLLLGTSVAHTSCGKAAMDTCPLNEKHTHAIHIIRGCPSMPNGWNRTEECPGSTACNMWYWGAHLESVSAAVSSIMNNPTFNEPIMHSNVFSLSSGTEFVGWLQMRNPGQPHTAPINLALRELLQCATEWYPTVEES